MCTLDATVTFSNLSNDMMGLTVLCPWTSGDRRQFLRGGMSQQENSELRLALTAKEVNTLEKGEA